MTNLQSLRQHTTLYEELYIGVILIFFMDKMEKYFAPPISRRLPVAVVVVATSRFATSYCETGNQK